MATLNMIMGVVSLLAAAASLVLHAMHKDKAAEVADEIKAADDKAKEVVSKL